MGQENNQASFDELPGIKKELRAGKQEISVDRCVLPAYCRFELIKTVLEMLESMPPEDEKQKPLIEALRAYLTSTEKLFDAQAAKDLGAKIGLYVGITIWLYGAFLVCGYSALPLTIGVAVMGVMSFCIPVAVLTLLGSAIGWGIATGINKIHTHRHSVKSEKLLKNLIAEPGFFSRKENDSTPTLSEHCTRAHSLSLN